MKNYSKVGNRAGRPGYRTPSSFRYKKFFLNSKAKQKARRGSGAGVKDRINKSHKKTIPKRAHG